MMVPCEGRVDNHADDVLYWSKIWDHVFDGNWKFKMTFQVANFFISEYSLLRNVSEWKKLLLVSVTLICEKNYKFLAYNVHTHNWWNDDWKWIKSDAEKGRKFKWLNVQYSDLREIEICVSNHIRKVCIDFMKDQLFITDKRRTRVIQPYSLEFGIIYITSICYRKS